MTSGQSDSLERSEHVVAGHHVLDLLQVPLVRGLAGTADLDQVHVMHQPAVVPDRAVADDGIADRQLAHLLGDLGRIDRIGGRDRAQIMARGGIHARLPHRRHGLVPFEELLREGAAGVVVGPGEAGDVGEALRDIQPHALDVGEERRRRHEADPRLLQSELVGGFERIDDVVAAARDHDAARLGGLRGQDERAEILHADRMLDRPERLAAHLLDGLAEIRFQRVAEGVVGGDEEPGVELLLAQRLHQAVGVGIGIPHPVEGRGPAALARQRQRARGAGDVDLLEGARDLLHRQCGAGVRHVHDQRNALGVVPAPRDRGGDVGLVLMVAADRLDRLAQHRPAHLLDRHPGARQRARTALVGEVAGHVVEHADGDGCRFGLRMRGMVVQASMQAAEMTTTLLVMTLSVARSYRLYANNHPCRVNGVGVAADRAGAK